MRMTRALAGGDVPSKENKPLDIENVFFNKRTPLIEEKAKVK